MLLDGNSKYGKTNYTKKVLARLIWTNSAQLNIKTRDLTVFYLKISAPTAQ
jgi:hypothetical protein